MFNSCEFSFTLIRCLQLPPWCWKNLFKDIMFHRAPIFRPKNIGKRSYSRSVKGFARSLNSGSISVVGNGTRNYAQVGKISDIFLFWSFFLNNLRLVGVKNWLLSSMGHLAEMVIWSWWSNWGLLCWNISKRLIFFFFWRRLTRLTRFDWLIFLLLLFSPTNAKIICLHSKPPRSKCKRQFSFNLSHLPP